MADPRRKNERVSAEVPVRVEGRAPGITRDLSPTGVYFVVDEKMTPGAIIRFSIEFSTAMDRGVPLQLTCIGTVVRVEESGGKNGVAVLITESRLEREKEQALTPNAAAG
jgi:hypothetical protein